jgi:1-acyl-sn-glycerol-3-phosphate acyltransferase
MAAQSGTIPEPEPGKFWMADTRPPNGNESGEADARAEALLAIVREMALELHPGRRERLSVTLTSDLDRDLGFDSLARVELLSRINRAFDVDLGESVLATAETPADLLTATAGARPNVASAASPPPQRQPLASLSATPAGAGTLIEALEWHTAAHGDRPHVYLYEENDEPVVLTYQDVSAGARAVAAGVRRLGLPHGSSLAIMLPTSADYLHCFLGVLMAGCVPVPIYPPTRASQLEDHLRRHARILDNAGASLLITIEAARPVARLLQAHVPRLVRVATAAELTASSGPAELPAATPADVAFLQYTSGSTGDPKGVVLTHANLLANIRAMGEAIEAGGEDVFVSWLPLYHDMGLIGAWLGSLYHGIPLVLMSPVAFLTNPIRWLRAIHQHRGTLSAAPNFAYELCLKRLDDTDVEGLDLSSLRLAFNGAEPVSPNTIRAFTSRFGRAGLRPEVLAPVYGLAEAAVGVAFPPPGRGASIDRIDRDLFLRDGRAKPAARDDPHALEFVGCGRALPGYALRIVDSAGHELPEREQGRLEFMGPSATSGYFHNPEATRQLFDGDWLDTGDLAYLADGDLYVTGRVKDTIIRAGRNLYPYELEEVIGALPDVRAGCVAVIGARDPATGTERVVVVAETRDTDPEAQEALIRTINGTATEVLGAPPDDVVVVPPHSVLKTSSGKIRRSAVKELYETGTLGRTPPPAYLQLVRLAASGAATRFRLWRRRAGRYAYAAWVHGVFWIITPLVWLAVVLAPSTAFGWAAARTGARTLLRLGAVAPQVEGLTNLPRGRPCVVVSNHASYLDGVVLVATLPVRVRFVAKAELASQRVAGPFLRRLGAAFVERFDLRSGVEDARRASALLQAEDSLLFFPEGTFTEQPGLQPFRSGAFIAAAERGLPVVPVVLRGTRAVLPGNSHFPRRHAISVHVGAPLLADGNDWDGAMRLRAAVRAAMLREVHEPDLEQPTRS